VEGMTCAINCAPQVKTALESIDGVRSVEVDFDTKTARILADPTLELTTEICDRSFANQGYFLEELHRNEGS
jgi:mercuric ion binding protein